MNTPVMDRFIALIDAADIATHLGEYRAAGFRLGAAIIEHEPGMRIGFVHFGREVFELFWVADEAAFAAATDGRSDLGAARAAAPRPFRVGLVADDLPALHSAWVARGYDLPALQTHTPPGAPPEGTPDWALQTLAETVLPGVRAFILQGSRLVERAVHVNPNTTYALAGASFVSATPAVDARAWRDFLAPDAPIACTGEGCAVTMGPHRLDWLTPEQYQRAYGRPWQPAPYSFGALAALHLLATDLRVVQSWLSRAGRRGVPLPNTAPTGRLLVLPHPHDGFLFTIREQPVADWARECAARTGETPEIAEPAARA